MRQINFLGSANFDAPDKIALADVFAAYYECRRNKRKTVNALAFELDFEKEVVRLWQEINSNTYKIGRSIAFIVKYPVQREVFAADFRDRVVHHLVMSKLNPLFEKEFISDSYNCRVGKGTLFGVKRIRRFIEECSANYSKECYILKLDVRSFFMSIDKRILFQLLRRFIIKKYHAPDKSIILRLVKQIVFYNPENNCVIKGKRSDWNGLPCHKSLFWSNKYCGLPIGNLTSQIFANFYFNMLDKYVTENLGIKYYGRYVDDFVLVHESKEVLLDAHKKIKNFLETRLRLQLHPQKFYLQECRKGVKFVGAVIKPNRIYIGNRTKNNLYQKIYSLLPQMASGVDAVLGNLMHFANCINSYIGFMRHYNTYNLRSKILNMIDKTFLGEAINMSPHATKVDIHKLFRPIEQKKYQLRKQRKYRKHQKNKLFRRK